MFPSNSYRVFSYSTLCPSMLLRATATLSYSRQYHTEPTMQSWSYSCSSLDNLYNVLAKLAHIEVYELRAKHNERNVIVHMPMKLISARYAVGKSAPPAVKVLLSLVEEQPRIRRKKCRRMLRIGQAVFEAVHIPRPHFPVPRLYLVVRENKMLGSPSKREKPPSLYASISAFELLQSFRAILPVMHSSANLVMSAVFPAPGFPKISVIISYQTKSIHSRLFEYIRFLSLSTSYLLFTRYLSQDSNNYPHNEQSADDAPENYKQGFPMFAEP